MRASEKYKILHFVANMKASGRNVIDSLIHYMNSMAKSESVKKTISKVIQEAQKGADIEKSLNLNGIMNDLQYSIISNSSNKNEAYKRVLVYSNENLLINSLYIKSTATLFLGVALIYYIWYFVIDRFVLNMITQFGAFSENGSMKVHPYCSFILESYEIMPSISIISASLFSIWLVYYFYTYYYDLEFHYKIFKFRALKDSLMYLSLIKDMLDAGTKSTKVFEILATHMYPVSSRDIWEDINDAKKNNNKQEIINGFKRLNLNDFTLYVIESGQELQEVKKGLLDAYNSVEEYHNETENKMELSIKGIWFYPVVLSIVGFLGFLMLISIDMGFV